MKKQYIQPQTEVINIQHTAPLMVGSSIGYGGDGFDAGNALAPGTEMPEELQQLMPGLPSFIFE